MSEPRSPEAGAPLSAQVFQILLSLLDGDMHGYALIQDIRRRTDDELVLTARAATPLRSVMAALGERSQRLAFAPPDYGPLLGVPREQTLGGVLASTLAGSRRVTAGAARDHFLGFEAVNGLGACFKAGGKVVKNVTGYDLPKLVAGSWGTLAVLTKAELLLPLIGGLYVVEAGSVIVQVASYKATGRRVFRMAPLHHHYELTGWAEPKIVVRFWIVSFMLARENS